MRSSWPVLPIALLASFLVPSIDGQKTAHAASPSRVEVELLSDTKGADLSTYLRTVASELKRKWSPSVANHERNSGSEPQQAVISLTIASDGHLSAMHLDQETQNTDFDKAALNAIQSTHYSTLPSALKDSDLKLRISFLDE